MGQKIETTMKKTIKKEVEICDFCKKLESWYKCQECGKAFCYDCFKSDGIQYPQGVYFSGKDGHYCKPCDEKLQAKPTPVWTAYRTIVWLRVESESFQKQFDEKRKRAEEQLNKLIGA